MVRNDNDDDMLCSYTQGKAQVPKVATAQSSNGAMTTNKVFEGIGDDDLWNLTLVKRLHVKRTFCIL